MNQQYLVVMDFPGIKNFVFGTDRLVEIRGASALLDYLNRKLIPELIRQAFPNQSREVFSGGGAGQFLIQGTKKAIRSAFEQIQQEISRQSGGGLRLIIGVAHVCNSYRDALDQAFFDLETQKRQNPFIPHGTCHVGFLRECDSCAGIAEKQTHYGGETRLLCRTCAQKEHAGRKRGAWEDFGKHLKSKEVATDEIKDWRPDDFNDIGKRCLTKPGYTALIYADGNAMGRVVKQIDTAERFTCFSRAVDSAIRDACYEAMSLHCCPPREGKIAADILLLGGDDLIVYVAADIAMAFAIDVAQLFEKTVKGILLSSKEREFFRKTLGDKGLSLSIGIAYGRSHTPISIMIAQAEELLKSAKKKGASLSETGTYIPSCIDFHFTSHFNQARVADSREHHLTLSSSQGKEVRLYGGPYTLKEAESLLTQADTLIRKQIPTSKLHQLGNAPPQGFREWHH